MVGGNSQGQRRVPNKKFPALQCSTGYAFKRRRSGRGARLRRPFPRQEQECGTLFDGEAHAGLEAEFSHDS